MKITMSDIRKRLQYFPEASINTSKRNVITEQASKVSSANEAMRLLESACRDVSNSIPQDIVLDLYDYIYENGTISQLRTATQRICNEYVARTRDAKDTQTNIRRRLSRAAGKVGNKVEKNIEDMQNAIKNAINGAKSNLQSNTSKIKQNVQNGLPHKKTEKEQKAQDEAYIDGLNEMDFMVTRIVHCDRILENYNRISKRFNIDKVIYENAVNGVYDTTVEIARLIETYDIPEAVKYNTVLETCWYGFHKSGSKFSIGEMVTAATDYFMAKGENHNMCVHLLENSLIVNKKDYIDDDLEIITEEEPEDDE